MPHPGGCSCGDVRFVINAEFDEFHLCHCHQCQKTTGTAHAANLFAAPDSLTWAAGEDKVTFYNIPGRVLSNAFCERCGSALPFVSVSGVAVVVPVGSLDQHPDMTPRHNIFWEERMPWVEHAAELNRWPYLTS